MIVRVCSFFVSSCWMSSANNLIWIFVAFVVMIEVVSKNNFKIYSLKDFISSRLILFNP